MRLWHYKLLPYLPKSQLIAQWRELNTIFSPNANSNHILINYVYEDLDSLYNYTNIVMNTMRDKGFKIRTLQKWIDFNKENNLYYRGEFMFKEHNDRYLLQCFYNLQEKYDRGQKDFDKDTYKRLVNYLADEHALLVHEYD